MRRVERIEHQRSERRQQVQIIAGDFFGIAGEGVIILRRAEITQLDHVDGNTQPLCLVQTRIEIFPRFERGGGITQRNFAVRYDDDISFDAII